MYKKRILQTLDEIEKLTGAGSASALRTAAIAETNETALFQMYQSIREVLAEETGDDSTFTFTGPDGKLHKAKTLTEAAAIVKIK